MRNRNDRSKVRKIIYENRKMKNEISRDGDERYKSESSVLYLNILLEKYVNGSLKTKLYDKRDISMCSIVNLPYLYRNIPSSPAHNSFCLSADSIRKGILYVCTIFKTIQTTDKQIGETSISTISIEIFIS